MAPMDFKKLIKKRSPCYYLVYGAVIALSVLIDQITKALAVKFLMPIDTVPIIKDAVHLTYAENRGAAFGMLADAPWVFNSVTVITVIGLSAYLFLGHPTGALYPTSIAMIIGGGIGNMIDRLAYGYVVDFIDFRIIDFAIFNGADSFVCVGAGLLMLAMILDIIKEARAERQRKEGGQ